MRGFRPIGLALLLSLTGLLSSAGATIISSGVMPANPAAWDANTWAIIGGGTGTLTVNGGSTITTYVGHIGEGLSSSGTVEISGAGSKWTSEAIEVGHSGFGSLSILNGGTVTTVVTRAGEEANVFVGLLDHADGRITVSGADSALIVHSSLFIGYDAGSTGTITQNDGLVSVGNTLYLGYAASASATYTLNGGTLAVHGLTNSAGTDIFNFNGGTLRADANFTTNVDATLTGTDTVDTNGNNINWNGALTGTGELVKTGAGTLTLNNYSYTGGTNVQKGMLVASHGFSCSSTSPLAIGITPSSCGVLRVTGAADVGGTLHVTSESGSYAPGATYTFLYADSITGLFANVVDDLAFFDLLLAYNSDNINFTLIPTHNYVDEARTFNQYGVASYLDARKGGATGDFSTVLDALNTLDGDGARGAFNAMSGEIYGSLATVAIENNERFVRTIANRMRMESMFHNADFATASTCRGNSVVYVNREFTNIDYIKNRLSGWTAWFDSYGVGASVAGNGNASGLGYSTGGLAVGMERYLDEHTLLGFGGGYASSRTSLDARSDWGSIDGGQFTAYMRRDIDSNYLTGVFAYGYNGYTAKRYIDFATIDRIASSNYGGNNYSAYVEAGRNLYGHYANWQPFAALEYLGVQQNPFAEQNANSIDLQVNEMNANAFRGLLGTRVLNYYRTKSDRLLTLDASAAWRHEFLNEDHVFDAAFIGQTGGAFAVSGVNVDRDAAIVGTGLSYALSDNCSIYANYDLLFSKDYTAHAGLGGFQYVW